MRSSAMLQTAIDIATRAHEGQTDKCGKPYIGHALRVMARLSGDTERMAAVLHDVVEDTPLSLGDLCELGIPDDVIEIVDFLTRRKDETYCAYIERVATHRTAIRVKLADIADNTDPRRTSPAVTARLLDRFAKAREVLIRAAGTMGVDISDIR